MGSVTSLPRWARYYEAGIVLALDVLALRPARTVPANSHMDDCMHLTDVLQLSLTVQLKYGLVPFVHAEALKHSLRMSQPLKSATSTSPTFMPAANCIKL